MYLRVDYDQQNWDLIYDTLTTDYKKIHVLNRAAILGDAFALALAGIQDYSLPLSLTEYLFEETEHDPLFIAMDNYDRLAGGILNSQKSRLIMSYLPSVILYFK